MQQNFRITNFDLNKLWEDNQGAIISAALDVLYAIVILVIGMAIIKRLVNVFRKVLTKRARAASARVAIRVSGRAQARMLV